MFTRLTRVAAARTTVLRTPLPATPTPRLLTTSSVRLYASKKGAKASRHARQQHHEEDDADDDLPVTKVVSGKGKGKKGVEEIVPGGEDVVESLEKSETKMKGAVEWFRKEVAMLESRGSGRVTPAYLDPVRVVAYKDAPPVKLQEIATIGVKEGSTLVVTVFEESMLKEVERALHGANIPGVHPQKVDERTLRIPVPKPTVEARTALLSSATKLAEDTRIKVRGAREGGMKELKKSVGKFTKSSPEAVDLQALTDKYIAEIDKIVQEAKKELDS
ncbi:hypothetical protein BOTBODRAFT_37615 [Botryobasidium botryosum FD-172 SS1]|uniref:Ribosome recycling factor domain-containing protein n=1 Tax=Botryobasidium botryosum (strain FD-172 SS1) TaxID=930990 RepID=A0A067LZ98_BOTB1|nr:hypothetical protein BOTBODRAFT_37615 [Botryobasidium botryosum FD-172 SS1]